MTGEVTDPSGAVVPNATVTLSNASTGVKYTQSTNAIGVYRFTNIPPGQGYEAVFTAKGFAKLAIKSIYLTVATTRTQNAVLQVSAATTEVQVTASNAEVTVDTNDATIGNTFDVVALNSLPVQQRNSPTALFTLQPGVTDTGSVTGARADQNNVTLDGLDVNDFATGGATQSNTGSGISTGFTAGSIVGHAPVDSVEEFHGNVGGLESTSGPASGGQFQLVTKSGTNSFHGNLNEYHRDPSLVANTWFGNNSDPIVPRNHLIQNQFGGNIGGPIRKDKLFFFFNFDESRVIRTVLTQRTVPLNDLRAGLIDYKGPGGAIEQADPATYDPLGKGTPQGWKTMFTGRFPASNNMVSGDGINSGGYAFNAPDNDNETNYVGRIDYNINDKQKLFGRFSILRENGVENPNEFLGDSVTNPLIDRSYAWVLGHTWVIGADKTNRITFGETVQKLSFPNQNNPMGSSFYTFGDGADSALTSSLYLNPTAQARRIPVPVLGDDFTWTKGSHSWQFGGTFKDILAHTTNTIDYNTAMIGLGGKTYGLDPSLRPTDITKSTSEFDEAFAFLLGRIGNISADYNYDAHGNALTQLSGDQRMYRYYQTQLYIQDNWKVLPNLTVSYGLNYQYFSVPYEIHGLESVEPFTFDQYFQARQTQSALGVAGPSSVPLIAYNRGGKGNGGTAPGLYTPEYKLMAPHVGFNWAPGFDRKMVINASAGIVYDRTIINAIQGQQDQYSYLFQQTNPISYGDADPTTSLKVSPRLDGNGGLSTVTISPAATPVAPYVPFGDAAGCAAKGLVAPCGLQTASAWNTTIDPSLKTPYAITFNAGVQRSLPGDMILKVNYAGRLGRRLLAQADANQVLDFVDPQSGQTLSQAFGAITQQARKQNLADSTNLTPQPWFEHVMGPVLGLPYGQATAAVAASNFSFTQNGDIGDFVAYNIAPGGTQVMNVGSAAQFSENTFFTNKGFSSYNGLLLTLQKNMSHGLHYDFNYTFAHSIDNVSFFANSQGDTGIGGVGLVCDVVRPRECRANSDFDVKHYITADASYQLPFGRNKMFLATVPSWLNKVVGDWDLSGIADWHTGQAWGTNSDAFVASFSNDAPAIFIGTDRSVIQTHVTKLSGGGVNIFKDSTAASESYEGPIGFQIGARNSLRGPHYFNADMGLGKKIPLYADKYNLNFRADAFNAFNHPNFALPASNGYNGLDQQDYLQGAGFGQISYTVEPPGNMNSGARVLQLALRMEF